MTVQPITPAALRTDRLREAREKHGLSQLGLALRMGVNTPTMVGSWERGYHEPSIWNFRELCRVLDVSADWLLGLEE